MFVLVACEESQRVCIEFRKLGHEAYSCDLLDCSGGHPEWHIKCDVLKLLYPDVRVCSFSPDISDDMYGSFQTMDGVFHELPSKWDLIIAHPPCTYLSNAGARWLYSGGVLNVDRYKKGIEGKNFFMSILAADCPKIAIENPVPSSVFGLPEYSQIIQPYQFGEPWSKKTCLWLKGLEPLIPSDIVTEYLPYCSSGSYSGTHDPRFKGVSRKGGSARIRSKTFVGIDRAMAVQWGCDVYG